LTDIEQDAWIGLIARIGIPAGVLTILMLPLFYVLVVSRSPDLNNPALELIGASQNLTAYRVYTLLETATFVFLSTLLFALGMVVRAHYPVIGNLIALAGTGNLVGILANFERLALIGGLAAAYPQADASARVVMEQTGAYFSQLYVSHIYMAWLMQSAASWLAAYATSRMAGFPRWLSLWMWLPGVTGILLILGGAFGAPREISLALFSLHLPVSLGTLCIGLALWSRSRGSAVGAPTTLRR
jgi:hypothetical protein